MWHYVEQTSLHESLNGVLRIWCPKKQSERCMESHGYTVLLWALPLTLGVIQYYPLFMGNISLGQKPKSPRTMSFFKTKTHMIRTEKRWVSQLDLYLSSPSPSPYVHSWVTTNIVKNAMSHPSTQLLSNLHCPELTRKWRKRSVNRNAMTLITTLWGWGDSAHTTVLSLHTISSHFQDDCFLGDRDCALLAWLPSHWSLGV